MNNKSKWFSYLICLVTLSAVLAIHGCSVLDRGKLNSHITDVISSTATTVNKSNDHLKTSARDSSKSPQYGMDTTKASRLLRNGDLTSTNINVHGKAPGSLQQYLPLVTPDAEIKVLKQDKTHKKHVLGGNGRNANRSPASIHVTQSTSEDTIEKSASLGVSYFPKMKFGETKLITAHVEINHSEAQIKKDLRNIIQQQTEWLKKSDTSSILTSTLTVYDSLKLSMSYDTADFEITFLNNTEEQQHIDFKAGNDWTWQIKAISADKRQARIILNVDAHTPDGVSHKLKPYEIPIVISFDFTDMLRGWVRYIGDHPKYTVPSLLVPLVVAIYRRKKKKGNENDKEKNNGEDDSTTTENTD